MPALRGLSEMGAGVRIVLAVMGLLLSATAAFAQTTACVEPALPPPLDGATANADQLREELRLAREFVAASNIYESCLNATRAQAADPTSQGAVVAQIAAIQKARERVSDDANRAMSDYKRSHPN